MVTSAFLDFLFTIISGLFAILPPVPNLPGFDQLAVGMAPITTELTRWNAVVPLWELVTILNVQITIWGVLMGKKWLLVMFRMVRGGG